MLSVVFFEAGGIFQKFVYFKLIHKGDLVNFSLLHDIVWIWKGEAQTLDEGLEVRLVNRFFFNSKFLAVLWMPDSFDFVEVGVFRLARGSASEVEFDDDGLGLVVDGSLGGGEGTWRWELY